MARETHDRSAFCSRFVELSLQELQTVSGGNYLDNMGTLNAFTAAEVLPRINSAQVLDPAAKPWRSWGSILGR
jgi:hypothetical protein